MALKSIVIKPGECAVLSSDAVVQSVIVTGSATATSSCGTLPTPTTYKCGFFFFIMDSDDNDGHSMDETNTSYTSVTVGDNTYMLNELVLSGDNPGTLTGVSTLNLHIPDTAIFQFMAITRTVVTARQHVHLYFQVPELLFDQVTLKINNRGVNSFQIYEPLESECEEYENPA